MAKISWNAPYCAQQAHIIISFVQWSIVHKFVSQLAPLPPRPTLQRVVKGIFLKRESAVLFLREAWNGYFISRETWFARQPGNVNQLFIFVWSVKWVIYFLWNVICPPAVSCDSWRNAHKKHCFCTPTEFPDIWGTRISKFSRWEHALGLP